MKRQKEPSEFENFDDTMRHLLAVPYTELQKKLEEEKQAKGKHKKKRATTSPASRVSSARKKRVV